MDSDDGQSVGLPSPWLGSLEAGCSATISVSSSTVAFAHTGQLSPISNGVDLPGRAVHTSAGLASPSQSPPVAPAARSVPASAHLYHWSVSDTSLRDVSGLLRPLENHGAHHQDDAWEEAEDEMLPLPKLEPLDDDDFCMHDLEAAPSNIEPGLSTFIQPAAVQPKLKRPRGRPRKHPLVPNVTSNKITKGRSKTGCLTCRKRKKKCDEAKPRCERTTKPFS